MAATAALSTELQTELRQRVTGEVRFDDMTRGLYSTDASIYQIRPLGVVYPKCKEDVQQVVQLAGRHGIPVLARGSGTSLSGQTVAEAIVVDFSRFMNQILEIDVEKQLVRVQPGVVLDQLNAALRPHGLQFGPDVSTSSRANLGGMMGNNSAGSRSVRQGKVIDHVRSQTVLLSDGTEIVTGPLSEEALRAKQKLTTLEGEIYRRFPQIVAENRRDILAKFPRILRRVSGYNLDAFVPEIQDQFPTAAVPQELDRKWPDRKQFNLSKLIVGAEGTLGVVVEALLHVVPLPRERGVVVLQFRTIDEALKAVPKILFCQPSAVELIDRNIIELSRQNLKYKKSLDFVAGTPEALLIVEFSADQPIQISDALLLLEQQMKGQAGLEKSIPAKDAEQREALWNCRKAGAPLLLSIPGARKPIAFVEDPAVEVSKLPEFTRRFSQILSFHGIAGAYYGHASVGCLHLRPMLDTKTVKDLTILKSVSDEVASLVQEFGGAMSGEHGDGLARSYHNVRLFGPKLFQAFQEVKRLFDPQNLFNPGKVVALPSPIENLRYGEKYPGAKVATFQDFSREEFIADAPGQGFLAAAEACNGSGVCRKTLTGTMCPSFMVTKDEEHSTRGRANALRLALTGQLGEQALTSQRMMDVMSLCLQCKACKAECPSNVDVAKLKVEFLGHYYQEHRPGLGTLLLGNAASLNRFGSKFASLANWMVQVPGMNYLTEWLTGIDHRRKLPKFASETFQSWFQKHKPDEYAGARGRVVLLDDCLTSHCEPHIPRTAVQLLEAAGYHVELAGLWCCGRPQISKGLIHKGKDLARQNAARLSEFVKRGLPILGVEPSCLLTLVDEYPDLFPSDATKRIKDNAFLIDTWMATRADAGKLDLTFKESPDSVLLHGHCQQKALVGTQGTKKTLGLVPGLKVQEVDSGCCGMAGSFGYEHYDVSMKIGERVLFPAAKSHSGTVVAPGFSCRHQLLDATGVQALHPVEVLAKSL